MITYEQFCQEGYVHLKSVLHISEINKFMDVIEESMGNERYACLLRKFSIPITLSANNVNNQEVIQIPAIFGSMPALRKNNVLTQIEECVFDLFNKPVRKTADSLIIKEATGSVNSPWHQDSAYDAPHPRMIRQVSVWVPLTMNSPGLIYLKDSCQLGKLPHQRSGDVYYLNQEIEEDLQLNTVTPNCSVGDVLIHHRNVIHRGEPNTTNRIHYNLTVNYEAIDD
jgi:hypothetical protein